MDSQSQLLRINSKFRNDPSNSTPSNFTYSIASTSATESVTKLELISFNMNRNFYNVASYNNQLMIKDGFSNVTTVQLNVGHYTIESIVVELNRVCNFTESEVQVILTWSIVNDRLQVVGNNSCRYRRCDICIPKTPNRCAVDAIAARCTSRTYHDKIID